MGCGTLGVQGLPQVGLLAQSPLTSIHGAIVGGPGEREGLCGRALPGVVGRWPSRRCPAVGGACWLWPWVAGQEEGSQGDCSKDRVRWSPASRTPGSVLEIAALRPHPSPTGPQLSVK